jgi:hypothetical protein
MQNLVERFNLLFNCCQVVIFIYKHNKHDHNAIRCKDYAEFQMKLSDNLMPYFVIQFHYQENEFVAPNQIYQHQTFYMFQLIRLSASQ